MHTETAVTIEELVSKSHILDFGDWSDDHSEAVLAVFRRADAERRFLTNEDLQCLARLEPHNAARQQVARTLREQIAAILSDSRVGILAQFPTIAEPGGHLYPPVRAESCGRDLWHYLRCISYAIAADQPRFTSDAGLRHLELLYRQLHVPFEAMVLGLASLKVASLLRCPVEQYDELAPYFDHLIDRLRHFGQAD